MIGVSVINSRYGPNRKQLDVFKEFLKTFDRSIHIFRHGMDKADIYIDSILAGLGYTRAGYPQGKSDIKFVDIEHINEPMLMADRNKKLIELSPIIIGVPQSMNELEDSPCWKTIRNAMLGNAEKEVYIISPAGFVWGWEE